MPIYLGLGSNSGDRSKNLVDAIKLIAAKAKIIRQSPLIETAAALMSTPTDAEWMSPFLNLVVEVEVDPGISARSFLEFLKTIEASMGRKDSRRWSPRTIDIDILFWRNLEFDSPDLEIPHPFLHLRDFVLNPLSALNSVLVLNNLNILQWKRNNPSSQSLLMAIVNLTPDSFSDGGKIKTLTNFEMYLEQIQNTASYIDLGAESTRPMATPLKADDEWRRLSPYINFYHKLRNFNSLLPRLSVDSYHFETLERAADLGLDVINDVSGFIDKRMSQLINSYHLDYVLMHNLGVPANKNVTLATNISSVKQVYSWFENKIAELESFGVSRARIILDPGIGFGKTPHQNLELLANTKQFHSLDCRTMIGASRKSFLSLLGGTPATSHCQTNMTMLDYLATQSIDILRVHDPVSLHKHILIQQKLRSLHADTIHSNFDLCTRRKHHRISDSQSKIDGTPRW